MKIELRTVLAAAQKASRVRSVKNDIQVK